MPGGTQARVSGFGERGSGDGIGNWRWPIADGRWPMGKAGSGERGGRDRRESTDFTDFTEFELPNFASSLFKSHFAFRLPSSDF